MGLLDTFKGNQYKQEIDRLNFELQQLKSTFTPEMREAANIQALIQSLKIEANNTSMLIAQKKAEINSLNGTINALNGTIFQKQNEIVCLDDEILFQSFGLYLPKYEFVNSDIYKQRLDNIRNMQKDLIKRNLAVTGNMAWSVNGSSSQGTKMVKDLQKLLLRAFNSECDELVEKVKYNNFDSSYKRMQKSCEAISKLGAIMSVAITQEYFNLKYQELCLAFEYRRKKQEEKEEQKEIKARMREEAKLQKEIEDARKKIQKEQSHYQNALKKINEQLLTASDIDKSDLLQKKLEIENNLQEIEVSIKDIDYREANARAGYVYIISNIGAFGEDVYKIGMTRRLEPQDRIDELGDASVPFNFDVHAMIFSDDAPRLENALHKAFEKNRLNMVNNRREFFKVTLDEIEKVVKMNYDKTVEFIKIPPAEQYRESQKMKQVP